MISGGVLAFAVLIGAVLVAMLGGSMKETNNVVIFKGQAFERSLHNRQDTIHRFERKGRRRTGTVVKYLIRVKPYHVKPA